MPKQAEKARTSSRDSDRDRDRRKRDEDDRGRASKESDTARGERKGTDSQRGSSGRARAATGEVKVTAKNLTSDERQFLNKHKAELSRTTLRAKWLHSGDEHEDRAGQSLATRSHEVIQQWAEARGAVPAAVPGTEHGNRRGVLRFMFNQSDDDGRSRGRNEDSRGGNRRDGEDDADRRGTRRRSSRLEEVSWDDWFRTFDERELVFVFQEHLKRGDDSNFFRFDSPERENE